MAGNSGRGFGALGGKYVPTSTPDLFVVVSSLSVGRISVFSVVQNLANLKLNYFNQILNLFFCFIFSLISITHPINCLSI